MTDEDKIHLRKAQASVIDTQLLLDEMDKSDLPNDIQSHRCKFAIGFLKFAVENLESILQSKQNREEIPEKAENNS